MEIEILEEDIAEARKIMRETTYPLWPSEAVQILSELVAERRLLLNDKFNVDVLEIENKYRRDIWGEVYDFVRDATSGARPTVGLINTVMSISHTADINRGGSNDTPIRSVTTLRDVSGDFPIHPGSILLYILLNLRAPPNTDKPIQFTEDHHDFMKILEGAKPVTPDFSNKIEELTGFPSYILMGLQKQFDKLSDDMK